MWACMGQFILRLACGGDPASILQSEAFIAAKRRWSDATQSKAPSMRREAVEASNIVQVQPHSVKHGSQRMCDKGGHEYV